MSRKSELFGVVFGASLLLASPSSAEPAKGGGDIKTGEVGREKKPVEEEVVVQGSRVRRKDLTSPSSVQPEPAKLYSVGRRFEPAKLYSVGTLVRPPTASFAGWYISGDVAGSFNKLYQTETFTMTNAVTNRFSDSSNVVGGGFGTGFLVPLGNSPILIGPSASIEFLRQDTFHTFPGNFFIGQTINGIGTLNAQIGVVANPGLLFFGEVGLGVANVDQKLNFGGPVTTVNRNVTGLNVGLGATYQPPNWQIGGNPVAIFTQINRIILPAATFENPGSPGFTYRNDVDVTMIEVGFRIQLPVRIDHLQAGWGR